MRHALRNEHELSKSPESPSPAPVEATSWQTSRLLLAVIVCAVIIGAAIAYEALG